MRAAVIENGKVVNIIEVQSLDFMPNLVEAGSANIGDSYADGVFYRAPADTSMAKAAILAEMARLEGAPNYINRGSRELEIVNMHDIATRKAEKFKADNPADERSVEQLAAEYLAATPYYVKLTALDAQIDELRAQYNALG